MPTVMYRAPVEDNEWWPLPPDYAELTIGGKRDARVSVCATQETPEDLVTAWAFFRDVYLRQNQVDGYFFRRYVPSPAFHAEMVHDAALYPRNAFAAPRGFSKSTVVGTELPLLLSLTRPYWRSTIGLSTDKMVEERLSVLMMQIGDNPAIVDDFGSLKPRRSQGRIWNKHILQLNNGAYIYGSSIMGKQRGGRPDIYILDDPERDPYGSTNISELLERFSTVLFQVIIPMLRENCPLLWVGTIINRRCSLYNAAYGEDPRFRFWNRRVYAAENGPENLLWPEMWPYGALMHRRAEIGPAVYSAEYLNKPVSDLECILNLDSELDGYVVDGDVSTPLTSESPVTFYNLPAASAQTTESEHFRDFRVSTPFGKYVSSMYRMITVDYAASLEPTADYSAILVTGLDRHGNLWVLDMWLGRARDFQLMQRVYALGAKWLPQIVGIESASLQKSLAENVGTFLQSDPHLWRPRVKPVQYPKGHDKPSRIANLEWRFASHRIKLPMEYRKRPMWNELFHEIDNFAPDIEKALEHDDALDALAMTRYVISASAYGRAPDVVSASTPIERVLNGEIMDAEGFPVIADPGAIHPAIVEKVLDNQADISHTRGRQRRSREDRYRHRGIRVVRTALGLGGNLRGE